MTDFSGGRAAELSADILVAGGGLGGVAAALAAARAGRSVVLTEETPWIGGQLTSQAVPPDEHPWIEQFGCTRTYRELRDRIRGYYRDWYPLTGSAREDRHLNPGAGKVSKLCAEPRAGLAALESMLAPHAAAGRIRLLTGRRPTAADMDGDQVRAVTFGDLTVSARYFIDATETGELLPLTGIDYVTGAESRAETGESRAPAKADPLNMQAVTWCFAVDHRAGEDYTIARPATYDFWRSYQPSFWPGPLLGWRAVHPRTLEVLEHSFIPNPDADPRAINADQSRDPGGNDLWLFRRILARLNFEPAFDSDVTLVNWPMADYLEGVLFEVPAEEAARHERAARELSLSLLYWLQTEAPRADGGSGFPGLRLRPDITGTDDGFAMRPYIRESRRIRARHTIVEGEVSPVAASYRDSVGVGCYRIDLHPSTGGDNYIDVPSCPFEIPLGALLPQRDTNLLPGCKNIGTTHITNGCFRMHPTEWNIGEVVGLLAAHCLDRSLTPGNVHGTAAHLEDFQGRLDREGVERRWPAVAGY